MPLRKDQRREAPPLTVSDWFNKEILPLELAKQAGLNTVHVQPSSNLTPSFCRHPSVSLEASQAAAQLSQSLHVAVAKKTLMFEPNNYRL